MFYRLSIVNSIRAWKKTIFYLALLILLASILSLGVSLSYSIDKCLIDAKETYKTTGSVQYIDMNYPNTDNIDHSLTEVSDSIDYLTLNKLSGVKKVDRNELALGYSDQFTSKMNSPYYPSVAVIIIYVTGKSDSEDSTYWCLPEKVLYSYHNVRSAFYFNSLGKDLTIGNYYLVNACEYSGQNSYAHYRVTAFDFDFAETNYGIDGSIDKMIQDVTTNDELGNKTYSVNNDSVFIKMAETYRVINSSLTVWATSSLEYLDPFQSSTISITKGRAFNEDEYGKTNKRVCLISERFADIYNYSIGSSINLKIVKSQSSVLSQSYWVEQDFAYIDTFEVVGIFSMSTIYNEYIFIPQVETIDLSSNHYSYTVAEISLENGITEEQINAIKNALPKITSSSATLRFSVDDQGYEVFVKPLQNILSIARIVTIVSALTVIAFLVLYGYMSIYKERNNGRIMYRLGSKKADIFTYYSFGSTIVALTGSFGGIALSFAFSSLLSLVLSSSVKNYQKGQFAYSLLAASLRGSFSFNVSVPFYIFLLIGLSITLVSFIFSAFFIVLAMNEKMKRKQSIIKNNKGRSATLKGGSFKYAILSILRTGFKAFVPIILGVSAVILFTKLPQIYNKYSDQMSSIASDSPISGYISSYDGRYNDGLSISGTLVNKLINSGYIDDYAVTSSGHYMYRGAVTVDGVEQPELAPFVAPSGFAYETLINNVKASARIVYCNKINGIAQFIYLGNIELTFKDGYSEKSLEEPWDGSSPLYTIVSQKFLEDNGLFLGDIFEILTLNNNQNGFQTFKLQIIGTYKNDGKEERIFCQISKFFNYTILTKKETNDDDKKHLAVNYFNSFTFSMNDAVKLQNFKNYLYTSGFSQINVTRNIRTYMVINDSNYIGTATSMGQRLNYMKRIFPVLYAAMILLGAIVPFIFIQGRKREIAIMNGLGSSKKNTFFSLFNEYWIMALIGVIIGFIFAYFVFNGIPLLGYILASLYFASWLIGTIISIENDNKKRVMDILHAE